MGNLSSSSVSESDDDGNVDFEDDTDSDADADKDDSAPFDLGDLFKPAALRTAASKIKDEMPENVVQQHQASLVRWLEERAARNEESVTLSQVYDLLLNRSSVTVEDCIRSFQQYDTEGDGVVDVPSMLDALRVSDNSFRGELAYVVKILQACSLTPGFIDIYNKDKEALSQHGSKILNFLFRNRAASPLFPYPILNGFNNTTQMRQSAAAHHLEKLKEHVSRHSTENLVKGGEELKPIYKCYSSVDVSSSKSDAPKLTNGDFSSYWQSDGTAKSHWIRLKMKNNVVLKQLSIGVSTTDQSYMPELIIISVGKNSDRLREIKEIRVPSYTIGDVTLLENMKISYPVIQINIRGCHSEGCDTRIHSLKTLGYRVVKESGGLSVSDATAGWFIQIVAATATSSLATNPMLRTLILNHTRDALKFIAPLALAPSSTERPSYLSSHVLKQIHAFLMEISIVEGKVYKDGLCVLLCFNLARGHMAGTLSALSMLQDDLSLELKMVSLLRNLESVRESFWRKQGSQQQLTLAGCDGGKKDDGLGPENVLTSNWNSTQAYVTDQGKTRINMFFQAANHIQLTRVKIKVDRGPKAPKKGLLFVYNHSNDTFKMEEHVEMFKSYDANPDDEKKEQNNISKPDEDKENKKDTISPVAELHLEEDWDEIDVTLDKSCVGKYVLIKFMEARQSSAERLSINGIRFYGFNRKESFLANHTLETSLSLPESGVEEDDQSVDSHTVFIRILQCMVCLTRDISTSVPNSKNAVFGKQSYLDMSDLSLDGLWSLYNRFTDQSCRILCLQLLHAIFPFLVDSATDHKEAASNFFVHLCDLVDTKLASDDVMGERLQQVATQAIVDGAALFFPDKDARRKQLFSMMNDVNSTTEVPSVFLTFQSLCQFFSTVDPSGLLDLPLIPAVDFNSSSVLAVLETLVSVACREHQSALEQSGSTNQQAAHLLTLLSSLQTSLLCWCQRQLDAPIITDTSNTSTNSPTTDKPQAVKHAMCLLVKYVNLVASTSCIACSEFLGKCDQGDDAAVLMEKMEGCFLSTTLRQLVLMLSLLVKKLSSPVRVQILTALKPVMLELRKLADKLPQFFYKVGSEAWKQVESGEVVLRNWDVESSHNYENNQHVTQIFSCPGSSTFIVEFDPRCETEKRYDYLEFTDSRGIHTRYDAKVGNDKWPTQTTFKGGHKLQFLFHSDSSNNEWGYKFKVTAKGCPDMPLCWMFDLYLSFSKLFGNLCGASLDVSHVLPQSIKPPSDSDPDVELLHSDLWTTLFRGGYMVGKLQRSLSGKHVAGDGMDARQFLHNMLDGESPGADILKKCQDQSTGTLLGGDDVKQAVIAVFTALLWHTQTLREDVDKLALAGGNGSPTDGMVQAYTTAASLSLVLLDQRQKQKLAAEAADKKDEEPDAVFLCKEKASFLLKFAGLSKFHLRSEAKQKSSEKRLARSTSRQQGIGNDKIFKSDAVMEKFPSFRLVLEFVRDVNWSKEKVEKLLKQRAEQAHAMADVYMFAAEFLRIMTEEHIFQVPSVLFLREMLVYQDTWGQHYARGLDGCGLELEAQIRSGYYALIRRLVNAITAAPRHQMSKSVCATYDYITACTLHLLDIDWQPYDLALLTELRLPEFYIQMAKGSIALREKTVETIGEEQELEDYKRNMEWLQDSKTRFVHWYERNIKTDTPATVKKSVQMFVAQFCDLLEVEISCDGCGATLPGRRYRCLLCQDMDLCTTCYAGGVKPGGDHKDDHDMVHLMYKCDECQAFIVGTRIHCIVCEDFDLCLGCQNAGHLPAGHTIEHDVITYPMIRLHLNQEIDTSLLSYLHQHVWLLFVSLSLSMSNLLYSRPVPVSPPVSVPVLALLAPSDTEDMTDGRTSPPVTDSMDLDYLKAAAELQCMCVQMSANCLTSASITDDNEPEESVEAFALRQREAFAIHSQERQMGLLGAMIPPHDMAVLPDDMSHPFTSHSFLKLLFSIAIGKTDHEETTQHFAMGLIHQLLQRTAISCKEVDEIVGTLSEQEIQDEGKPEGYKTACFLFNFGATCLERSGLAWANSMSQMLQQMFDVATWREVLSSHLADCVLHLLKEIKLSSIFALFVIAGFPEVLSIGSFVRYNRNGNETRSGFVLKHFPDKSQTLLVDDKSRKRRTTNDDTVECVPYKIQFLDEHMNVFIQIIQSVGSTGSERTVENLWVLSLCLKAVLSSLQKKPGQTRLLPSLFTSTFLQTIVSFASKGTDLSQQWLLKDLEVLSLMLYTREREKSKETEEEEAKAKNEESGWETVSEKEEVSSVQEADEKKCEVISEQSTVKSEADTTDSVTSSDIVPETSTDTANVAPEKAAEVLGKEDNMKSVPETSTDTSTVTPENAGEVSSKEDKSGDIVQDSSTDTTIVTGEVRGVEDNVTSGDKLTVINNDVPQSPAANEHSATPPTTTTVTSSMPETTMSSPPKAPAASEQSATQPTTTSSMPNTTTSSPTKTVTATETTTLSKAVSGSPTQSATTGASPAEKSTASSSAAATATSTPKPKPTVMSSSLSTRTSSPQSAMSSVPAFLAAAVSAAASNTLATLPAPSMSTSSLESSLALATLTGIPENLSLGNVDPDFTVLENQLEKVWDVWRAYQEARGTGSSLDLFEQVQNEEPLKKKLEVTSLADTALDTGMQLLTVNKEVTRNYDKAEPEPSWESQRLISAPESDLQTNVMKQRRSKSAVLMKEQLEAQGKAGSRSFLLKVNMAMVILSSRQLLLSLLADWPTEGHCITGPLIGCQDSAHLPFILDLLNRTEASADFKQVVQNVIKYCDGEVVVPIAMTSVNFMEEANLLSVTKESDHNYPDNLCTKDKIIIPGAAYLSVKFDARCHTEEQCDELTIASSDDLKQNKQIFSGTRERWNDFEIPGDTLYFKFTSDSSNNYWGYKMTVTGGKIGRFETGCLILQELLSSPDVVRLLPLDAVWSSLVHVACQQTGQQRLKALNLLLKLLDMQHKRSGVDDLQIDLGLLRGLWHLYTDMSNDSPESSTVLDPVIRALTELFVVAETLAQEWEIETEYIANLMSTKDIQKVMLQGLQNVAAVSSVIGVSNKATEWFESPRLRMMAAFAKITAAVEAASTVS